MPLQNRVAPDGTIFATPERGMLMGNRGGQMHDDARRLTHRRWVSRQWISCVLQYKDRQETIMAPGRYTQLFFLDEATALAAGHRPCALCRRADFLRFMSLWQKTHLEQLSQPTPHPGPPPQGGRGHSAAVETALEHPPLESPPPVRGRVREGGSTRPKVDEVDRRLHNERVDEKRGKRTFCSCLRDLPEGTMIASAGGPQLYRGGKLLAWSPSGYGAPAATTANTHVNVLTPPSIVAILAAGYVPLLHPSARSMSTAKS